MNRTSERAETVQAKNRSKCLCHVEIGALKQENTHLKLQVEGMRKNAAAHASRAQAYEQVGRQLEAENTSLKSQVEDLQLLVERMQQSQIHDEKLLIDGAPS